MSGYWIKKTFKSNGVEFAKGHMFDDVFFSEEINGKYNPNAKGLKLRSSKQSMIDVNGL